MVLRWVVGETTRRSGYLLSISFAVLMAASIYNAMKVHGPLAAVWGDAVLQTISCALAIVGATIAAVRVTGAARVWRLLIAMAMTCWFAAQILWWWQALVLDRGMSTSLIGAIGHYAFLVLAVSALVILAWSDDRIGRQMLERRSPGSVVVVVFDALVALASFAVLVWSSGTGSDGFRIPNSGGRPPSLIYAIAGLLVVVIAVTLSSAYRADERYRANFVLLAAGITTIIASDRLIAYLVGVGIESGRLWARVGFVLGPLLIAAAVLRLRSDAAPDDDRSRRAMVWVQMLHPYVGAVGISLLIGFHLLVLHRIDAVQVILSVAIVVLLVGRQIVSLREIRRLLDRVYAGQRRLLHQLHHDALTGLPNRLLFAERLDDALSSGEPFVLTYLDLDDFKDVNDRYGHAAGDRLLQAVGRRLSGCARTGDTVARIGGDEFAILVRGDIGPPEAFADRVRASLRPPFALHGQSVRVRASMGLVTPDPLASPLSSDELLRRADSSMYEGKRRGKGSAVLYRHSVGASIDFPTAVRLASGRAPVGFSVVYQPIVALPEGTPVALEALARWTAPNGTLVSPETFVASAEAAGLGAEFDAMVLDQVCAEIVTAGVDLPVHVNIGAARLGDRAFEEVVADTVTRHGVAPQQMVLEITESVPIADLAVGAAAVKRLQAIGVRVALDDFGAGYNTLTYLHALPVDIIKLDRSLTMCIEPGHDAVLYRSVLGICEQLGLDVIAEGVETSAQANTILSAGCTAAQGYRFGRPGPLAEVPSLRDQPITSVNAAR